MIVDVHAHYYPTDYLDAIGRPELPPVGAAPLRHVSIEERIPMLDRLGIDVQVLSCSQAQPYLPDAANAAAAATLGNDRYLELCRRYPGRFYTFATLPLPHIAESLAEIERIYDDPDVVGITIGCSIAGRGLDDPEFEPVFAELHRRKSVVLLHPMGIDCIYGGQDYNLQWLVGAPFEDTIAALRLALSGRANRNHDISFIVPHLGGTLPFLLARVLRMMGPNAEPAEAALRRMYYDTVSGSVGALHCAADYWGVDRLLFGTDFPYSDLPEFERRLTYFDEAGYAGEVLDQILGTRAEELLGLARRRSAT